MGSLYPAGTDEKNYLNAYSQQFNTIELNASFYAVPEPAEVRRWLDQVAKRPDFKFCPRFPQTITHKRRLAHAEMPTAQFYDSIHVLGNHVGALLLQLADNFRPGNFDQLHDYLQALPTVFPVFLEVRNTAWFTDPQTSARLFAMLRELKIGTVITDTPGRRDAVHMELSTPQAMIRFAGSNLHPTDYIRADAWVDRIARWRDKGLQTLWLFVHQPDDLHSPAMANYFIDKLNTALGTKIDRPLFFA